jgi:hypothetical protein
VTPEIRPKRPESSAVAMTLPVERRRDLNEGSARGVFARLRRGRHGTQRTGGSRHVLEGSDPGRDLRARRPQRSLSGFAADRGKSSLRQPASPAASPRARRHRYRMVSRGRCSTDVDSLHCGAAVKLEPTRSVNAEMRRPRGAAPAPRIPGEIVPAVVTRSAASAAHTMAAWHIGETARREGGVERHVSSRERGDGPPWLADRGE